MASFVVFYFSVLPVFPELILDGVEHEPVPLVGDGKLHTDGGVGDGWSHELTFPSARAPESGVFAGAGHRDRRTAGRAEVVFGRVVAEGLPWIELPQNVGDGVHVHEGSFCLEL